MTDAPQTPIERMATRRIELSAVPIGRMIQIISFIAGLISIFVIGSVVTLAVLKIDIPEVLSNWGGIILGFYFGQFVSLVKDYMGILQNAPQSGTTPPPPPTTP